MTDAGDMSGIEAPAPAEGIDWDALSARLASAASAAVSGASGFVLPSYRRIWFQSLIRQGREAEGAGRAALAAHCRARLEQEFTALGVPEALSGASSATAETPAPSRPGGAPEAGRRKDATPAAPGLSSEAPSSPLKALAARRLLAAHARLRELLDRHDFRLSPDEAAVFRQALDAALASAAGGATISELRRRLVDRLMRAARYRRQAARLAAWKPAPPSAVSGPYNDYRALEDLLHRVAASGPHAAEWAAEFFDIYADMRGMRLAYGTLLPG